MVRITNIIHPQIDSDNPVNSKFNAWVDFTIPPRIKEHIRKKGEEPPEAINVDIDLELFLSYMSSMFALGEDDVIWTWSSFISEIIPKLPESFGLMSYFGIEDNIIDIKLEILGETYSIGGKIEYLFGWLCSEGFRIINEDDDFLSDDTSDQYDSMPDEELDLLGDVVRNLGNELGFNLDDEPVDAHMVEGEEPYIPRGMPRHPFFNQYPFSECIDNYERALYVEEDYYDSLADELIAFYDDEEAGVHLELDIGDWVFMKHPLYLFGRVSAGFLDRVTVDIYGDRISLVDIPHNGIIKVEFNVGTRVIIDDTAQSGVVSDIYGFHEHNNVDDKDIYLLYVIQTDGIDDEVGEVKFVDGFSLAEETQ